MNSSGDLEDFEHKEQLEGAIRNFEMIFGSESSSRDMILAELTRAKYVEDARDYSNRSATEGESNEVASQAAGDHAIASLAKIQQENTALKMQLELMENQKKLLENDCAEKSLRISKLENELRELKVRQPELPNLHRQYIELQKRVRSIDEEAKKQVSKIEEEFLSVQQSAESGWEIRNRAQVVAATHVRNRQLTTNKLQEANSEINRLKCVIATLEERVARNTDVNISEDYDMGNAT